MRLFWLIDSDVSSDKLINLYGNQADLFVALMANNLHGELAQ
jgi:hypothetical protein